MATFRTAIDAVTTGNIGSVWNRSVTDDQGKTDGCAGARRDQFKSMTAPANLSLAGVFEQYRDRPWIFLRGLGNWGDHLLFSGAEHLADRHGLNWETREPSAFQETIATPDHCIYIHGNGGYNSWTSGSAIVNLELATSQPASVVVQGPISVGGDLDWLANRMRDALAQFSCNRLIFFTRESYSYNAVRRFELPENVIDLALDHDSALSLTCDDLLNIAGLKRMPSGKYHLTVAREDQEQPKDRKPNFLPVAQGLAIDPAYAASSFRHWVRIHLFAKSIVTNRLHSSIIGAVAGKPVTISAGSYHKNRSVWEHSLSAKGVRWVDSFAPPPSAVWSALPDWIRNSYKIRRLRLAMHRVPLS